MTNELHIFRAVELARAMIRQGQKAGFAAREAARAFQVGEIGAVLHLAVEAEDSLAAWRASRPAELEETA